MLFTCSFGLLVQDFAPVSINASYFCVEEAGVVPFQSRIVLGASETKVDGLNFDVRWLILS